ncbi:ATP-binding protein [Variovorax sp. RB2P76]|uniref:hybrid sensor histidine kinase/response regulator n=1 Tax=Variovorax sp. RB2P76 TaxID=3443736 RepID=UPI003F486A1E
MRLFWRRLLAVSAALSALASFGCAAAGSSLLSEEENAWIAQHRTLRVALSQTSLPMEYLDKGVMRGLSIEYANLIARRTGLRFVYVSDADKPKRQLLKDREADLSFAITYNDFPLVASGVAAVPTKAAHPLLVISRVGQSVVKDPAQFKGKTVAVLEGWPFEDELKSAAPGVTLVKAANGPDVLAKLVAEKADFAIGNELIFLPYLHRRLEGQLQIAGIYGTRLGGATVLIREDDAVLRSILEKTLASLTAEEAHELYGRWLDRDSPDVPSAEALGRHFALELSLASLLVLLLAIVLVQFYRQRESAVRNEREKARFLAIVSHEIRSPMNAVLAAVELLRNTTLNEQQRHFAQLANSGGLTLLRLIEDVLDISKLEAGQLRLDREPVDLNALVRNIADLHRLRAHEKKIALDVTASPLPSWLMLDEARVAQILHNLISNAIKFTQTGGVTVAVAISAAKPGWADLVVEVADTGIGVSPETQARLFLPYVQAAQTYKRSGGTGLGLAICRELATLMGGRIELASKLGEGTTVTLSLTAEVVADDDPRIATRTLDTGLQDVAARARLVESRGRLRVLVVEDTPVNQQVLQAQIESLGCEVEMAVDGAQAEVAFAKGSFDLILMDCDLPDTDGYTLSTVLREVEGELERTRTPIIAISASNDEAHVERCFASGMDGVLSKPIRTSKLQNVIELWCAPPNETPASADAPEVLPDVPAAACSTVRAHLQADLNAVCDAMAANDTDAACRAAHRLHGAALTLGLDTLAQPAGQLEALLRTGAGDESRSALASLLECWHLQFPSS